jgi:Icc protein
VGAAHEAVNVARTGRDTPFTLVQLTDPHLGAPWSDDPEAALAAAVDAVRQTLGGAPDAVFVSGDIANTPADDEYERARRQLRRLQAPLYVLAGNHDDRDGLRRHFELPPTPPGHLSYAADLGPARLVALDTQLPGEAGGRLDAERLGWLERVLGEDDHAPTLLATHHPPLRTGLPGMDAIGIPQPEVDALAEILSRHPQVQMVASGHVHRAIIGAIAGVPVLAIPSTGTQLALDLHAEKLSFVREPPCFAIHLLTRGRFVAHIQPVHLAAG